MEAKAFIKHGDKRHTDRDSLTKTMKMYQKPTRTTNSFIYRWISSAHYQNGNPIEQDCY